MTDKAKEPAIKSITIHIGGQDVQVTLEEARALKGSLEELLGEKVQVVRVPQVIPYPVPRDPPYPYRQPGWGKNTGDFFESPYYTLSQQKTTSGCSHWS